jgi:hypothetical protein
MPRRQDACCRQSHSSPRWKPRRIKAVATFSLTRFLQRRVQKSDKLTSASFQPPAVVPSGSRKTPLKRSRSSPAAQPLGSLGGTASRSRPCFPPSSSPVAQAQKHRKRGDNRRDEFLRLSLRLSKLSRCFHLAFDGVTASTEQRSAHSVNGPDPIDKRMGTEEWLDSFVPILLSIRSSRLRDSSRVFASKKASQALKHRKRWDNRRDELLRLTLRLSKLSRCFLLGFGMFSERVRSNRQKNGDRRMARFFCPHSLVETGFRPA